MLEFRPAAERGTANHGWLHSHHSFSFGSYYDPARMGVSDLRVLNDDTVAPGGGFPTHGHADMEILSYVLEGELAHTDSMGNTHRVRPGEIQLMRTGSGVRHSEMNASNNNPVHFLQIWIQPAHRSTEPGYAQQALDADALHQGFQEIAGPDHAVPIDQDARLLAAWPRAGMAHRLALDAERQYYLHVASGDVRAGERSMVSGDALVMHGETALEVEAAADSQVLLFDLRPEARH